MKHLRRAALAEVLVLAALFAFPSGAAAETKNPGRPVDFSAQVRPILSGKCFHCHGPDESSRKAKLRFDIRDEALKDHKGTRAIVPGDLKASAMIKRITTSDADDIMPPPKEGHPLTAAEIEILKRWVKEGAVYSEHWAFRKPLKPAVPRNGRGWASNEVDRFILAKLADERLKPSPVADRATLIRRASLDLTGLPPTPEETEAFVNDKSPKAFEKVVDRLLASPAYGERWARVWMDLARYADSSGYGSDPLRLNIWPWRDWVINALNRNLSYRDFTIQQIAGDLLPDATTEHQIATGFHRNTMTNTEGGTDDEEWRVAAVKDRADVTSQVWMGLTMGCAKCHTHKFDPITQREYYQFYAFFNQTEDNDQPDESPTLPLPTPEQKIKMEAITKEIDQLEASRKLNTDALKKDEADWEARDKAGYHWENLSPTTIAASRGATPTITADGMIEIGGGLEPGEVVTVKVPLPKEADKLTALRIEALPSTNTPPAAEIKLNEFRAYNVPASAAPVKARFVRVELPGGQRRLSLAEVQVMAAGVNVGPQGTASQSTTSNGGEASKAIDGKTDGDFANGSTTLTEAQDNPWWEVDLGRETVLDFVSLWNRTDRGLGTRLTDYRVLALNEKREKVWERGGSSAPTPEITFRALNETQIGLQNATADYQSEGDGPERLIDGNTGSGWSLKGEASTPHEAVVELYGAASTEAASTLVFTLQGNVPKNSGSVRLRLSGTKAPKPVRTPSQMLARILEKPAADRSEKDVESLLNFIRPFAPSLQGVRDQLAEKRNALAGIRPVALPVMRERAEKRVSHLLNKSNYLDPGEVVEPNVPAAFHPLPGDKPRNRLGLAEWLVSRENPMTARVAVNRFWSQLFGTGLVETEEDFGTQGALPSHPELLDWLAVEFMDRDWDMKAMLRLMVLSSTYQQSAKVTPRLLEKDPRNRLLARAPRRRLEAEMVRDQALMLAGLLSRKIGGPSVYPVQPDGLWRAAFNGERTWATSEGEDRHRRGLYTFWRRTVPYPSMVTFDAPSRETCTVRRIPTNTPLQSFVTLNDPVYVEAAQGLARRIMKEGGSTVAARVRYALRLCTGHPAAEAQAKALEALYRSELGNYTTNPADAVKLATEPLGPLPAGVAAPEAAAWTTVANVLLNLDALMVKG